MTPTADARVAWEYHAATRHIPGAPGGSLGELDWANQPLPFKIYPTLEPIAPPADLGRLCRYSNGIMRWLPIPGGQMAFRAAACAGALYHVELYLVSGPRADLEAGVYHYGAHDHALRRLRAGDWRPLLVEASGGEPRLARAPLIVVLTSTFWRNAWRYGARAYRHTFWDSGTILANLLALAAGPRRLVLGFGDEMVNRLLDVDPRREAAVCLLALGSADQEVGGESMAVEPLGLPVRRRSAHEVEYPEITALQAASSLGSGAEAAAWRGEGVSADSSLLLRPAKRRNEDVPVARPFEDRPGGEGVEEVIRRRGSARRFSHAPIAPEQLASIMDFAGQPIESDIGDLVGLTTPHLLVNADERREVAGFLALGQQLAADAAASIYWLADLHKVLGRFGNRGYRAAQLAAGIQGGRVYLAAYALGLGATGLTFFDDEVSRLFATDDSPMFLMAVGHRR